MIDFQVAKSDQFRRDGADIHSDVEINVCQAILGGTVRVPGLYEDFVLKVHLLFISYFLYVWIVL